LLGGRLPSRLKLEITSLESRVHFTIPWTSGLIHCSAVGYF
jgi:hypothetical protein